MCLGSQAAHADWTLLRVENSGTCSSAGHPTSWNVSKNPKIDKLSAEMGATAQPSTISSQGTITLVFGWSPTPGKTRPKTLTVLASTLAKLVSYGDGTPVILSGITVDNGHGSPQQLVVEGNDVYSTRTYSSSGKWLLTVDADGGKTNAASGLWEVQVPLAGLHTEASAQTATTRVHASFVQALVAGDATVDTRSVKLSRNGKDRFELKDGSWVTYGDSRFSYLKRTLPSANPIQIAIGLIGWPLYEDKPQIVKQPIAAVPEGKWWAIAPDFKWNESSANDTATQHTQETTQGGSVWNPEGIDQVTSTSGLSFTNKSVVPGGWYDVKHDKNTLKVFYKMTDFDGTTADASYVLTLHDEWENPTPDNGMFWIEDPNKIPHFGESLSGWQYRAVGVTSPSKDADWGMDAKADLEVKLTSETSADFGVADWLKISGSASTTATLDVSTSVAIHIKPSEIFGDGFSTSSYAAVIRYKVKSKRFLVDHYSEDGRDVNLIYPLVDPVSGGKWPKTGESEVVQPEPYWVEIGFTGGEPEGDHPLPIPTPPPTSKSATSTNTGSASAQMPTPEPTPTPQPSGHSS